jgi:hypothetical protein
MHGPRNIKNNKALFKLGKTIQIECQIGDICKKILADIYTEDGFIHRREMQWNCGVAIGVRHVRKRVTKQNGIL